MNKALVMLIAFMAIIPFSHAQVRDTSKQRMSDADLGHYYLQKSKSQKTIAWIMLLAGTAGWIGGAAASVNSDSYYSEDLNGGDVVMLLGFGLTVASIPMFINAAKNKGRAEILLRHENIPLSYKPSGYKSFPAVGIRIQINGK